MNVRRFARRQYATPLPETLALDFIGRGDTLDPRVTFSRTSNATQFDSAGNLVYAPHNLLTFSEQFDNAAWGKTNGTVTANSVAAPNSTTTADVLIADATNAEHVFDQAFTAVAGNTYTVSAHFRSNGLTDVGLRFTVGGLWPGGVAPQVRFNLANGTTTVVGGSPSSSSIQDIGGGWFRCSMSAACVVGGSSGARVQLMSGGNNVFAGNNVNGIAAWGAQLNIGTLQPYNTTTVKNALGFAQEFDNAAWTKTNSFVQTNQIRNNTMQGAVAGSPGTAPTNWSSAATTNGLNRQIVGSGISDGIAYIDVRYSGTTTAGAFVNFVGPEANNFIAASNGQSWTSSAWVAVVAGSTANLTNLSMRTRFSDSGGVELTQAAVNLLAATSTMQRFNIASTASNASTAFVATNFSFQFNSGVAVDITLRIGWPQLVQGAVAGDPVATYGTARAVMYPAPDGSVTGDKWVENTATSTHTLQQSATWLAGTRYMLSTYFRIGERSRIQLRFVSAGSTWGVSSEPNCTFNLSTGTAGAVSDATAGNLATAGIENAGGGWYRCWIAATCVTAGSTGVRALVADNTGNASYTGDGTSGIYIWGAQLSDSASLDPYVYNPVAAPTAAAYYGPRFDYDPATLAARGLLIEEQRTNSIRNNTMQGAVAPSTFPTNWQSVIAAGLTTTIIGTGAENGVTYLDVRVSGTPAVSTFYNLVPDILVAGASGQTWAGSFWAKLVAGSLTNTAANIELRESDAAQGFLTNSIASVPISSTLTRYSLVRTLTNASTAFASIRFVWQVTNGLPVDFTLRIGLPQLELGAFATSVIPTTTAAATRTADVASMIGANFSNWYRQDEGTLFVETTRGYTGNFVSFPHTAGLSDGSSNNVVWAGYAINGSQALTPEITTAGVDQFNFVSAVYSMATAKNAIAYKTNDSQWFFNGTAFATDTTCTMPSGLNKLSIGADAANAQQWGGWIRRVAYYPRRLSQPEGVSITT